MSPLLKLLYLREISSQMQIATGLSVCQAALSMMSCLSITNFGLFLPVALTRRPLAMTFSLNFDS